MCKVDCVVTESTINGELNNISNWLASNKLSLNVRKTKFLIFYSDKKTIAYPHLHMNLFIKKISWTNIEL